MVLINRTTVVTLLGVIVSFFIQFLQIIRFKNEFVSVDLSNQQLYDQQKKSILALSWIQSLAPLFIFFGMSLFAREPYRFNSKFWYRLFLPVVVFCLVVSGITTYIFSKQIIIDKINIIVVLSVLTCVSQLGLVVFRNSFEEEETTQERFITPNQQNAKKGCKDIVHFISSLAQKVNNILEQVGNDVHENSDEWNHIQQMKQQMKIVNYNINIYTKNSENRDINITTNVNNIYFAFESICEIISTQILLINDPEIFTKQQIAQLSTIVNEYQDNIESVKQNFLQYTSQDCGALPSSVNSYNNKQHYPQFVIDPLLRPWFRDLQKWAIEPQKSEKLSKHRSSFDNDPRSLRINEIVNKDMEQIVGDSRFFFLFSSKLIGPDGCVSPFILSENINLKGISKLRGILKNDHPIFVDALIKTIKNGYLEEDYPPIFENPSDKIFELFIKPKMYDICTKQQGQDDGRRLHFLIKNKNPRVTQQIIQFCENAKYKQQRNDLLDILLSRDDELAMQYLDQYSVEYLNKNNLIHYIHYHPVIKYKSSFIKYYQKKTNPNYDINKFLSMIETDGQTFLQKIEEENDLNDINLLNFVNIQHKRVVTDFLIRNPDFVTYAFFYNNTSKDVMKFISQHFVPNDSKHLTEIVATVLNNPYATRILTDANMILRGSDRLHNQELDLFQKYQTEQLNKLNTLQN